MAYSHSKKKNACVCTQETSLLSHPKDICRSWTEFDLGEFSRQAQNLICNGCLSIWWSCSIVLTFGFCEQVLYPGIYQVGYLYAEYRGKKFMHVIGKAVFHVSEQSLKSKYSCHSCVITPYLCVWQNVQVSGNGCFHCLFIRNQAKPEDCYQTTNNKLHCFHWTTYLLEVIWHFTNLLK